MLLVSGVAAAVVAVMRACGWGIWLIGTATAWWVAPVTVVAPVAMTYFLVHATGARLLEGSACMDRAGASRSTR
ncbi:DUF1295 domain-containing protein [Nocardioides sp. NPDC057772]|uniref:DUF1295 domain-containing protein n=1 Tax=Nocardioides sp. NPDC057772 TaxID=3346245 RepID=UPI0036705545